MRALDESLLRGRAKACLTDVVLLHLTNASIDSLKNIQVCRKLLASYADENRLVDIDALVELNRALWKIDLNGNLLRDLEPLASFRELDFLFLERNQLTFSDLIPLREIHLIELRLDGNKALGNEYQFKVIALLPNVWILDGHFIKATDRLSAEEKYEKFVNEMFQVRQEEINTKKSTDTGGSPGRFTLFGSAAPFWDTMSVSDMNELPVQHRKMKQLLDSLVRMQPSDGLFSRQDHNKVTNADKVDTLKLRASMEFYTEICTIHNAHVHFAPSKQFPNARPMSRPQLANLLQLSSRKRLDIAVILSAFLEYKLPRAVTKEALVIVLVDCEGMSTQESLSNVNEIVSLPTFMTVGLLFELRQSSMAQIYNDQNRSKSSAFAVLDTEMEINMWKSMPFILRTLQQDSKFTQDVTNKDNFLSSSSAMAAACDDLVHNQSSGSSKKARDRYALALLSKAPSFPDLTTIESGTIPSNCSIKRTLHELQPFLRSAGVCVLNDRADNDESSSLCTGIMPWFGKSVLGGSTIANPAPRGVPSKLPWNDMTAKSLSRNYQRPWAQNGFTSPLEEQKTAPTGEFRHYRRRPRKGDWIQLKKSNKILYLKVKKDQVNNDDSVLLAAPLKESCNPQIQESQQVIIGIEMLTPLTGNMWHFHADFQTEAERIVHQITSQTLESSQIIGKLHRNNEAYHRHGVKRNEGCPNHQIAEREMNQLSPEFVERSLLSIQASAIEGFASNETLDANYVLASPSIILAQNEKQRKQVRTQAHVLAVSASEGSLSSSLWSSIKQIPFTKVPVCENNLQYNCIKTSRTIKEVLDEDAPSSEKQGIESSNSLPPAMLKKKKQMELDDWNVIKAEMESVLRIREGESKRKKDTDDRTDLSTTFLTTFSLSSETQKQPSPTVSATRSTLNSESSASLSFMPSGHHQHQLHKPQDWYQVATKPQFLTAASAFDNECLCPNSSQRSYPDVCKASSSPLLQQSEGVPLELDKNVARVHPGKQIARVIISLPML